VGMWGGSGVKWVGVWGVSEIFGLRDMYGSAGWGWHGVEWWGGCGLVWGGVGVG
jgi:hypothetical protein